MTDQIDDLLLAALDEQDAEQTEETPKVDPAEVEELRTFRKEREEADRALAISEVFKSVGVNPRAAKLWATLNDGDPTPEAVKAFAAEYGLPVEKATGFTPTALGAEGRVPVARTYTRAEMEEIARVNPARAEALYAAGKIKWNNEGVGKR